eukprot:461497_1
MMSLSSETPYKSLSFCCRFCRKKFKKRSVLQTHLSTYHIKTNKYISKQQCNNATDESKQYSDENNQSDSPSYASSDYSSNYSSESIINNTKTYKLNANKSDIKTKTKRKVNEMNNKNENNILFQPIKPSKKKQKLNNNTFDNACKDISFTIAS